MKKGEKSLGKQAMVPVGVAISALSGGSGLLTAAITATSTAPPASAAALNAPVVGVASTADGGGYWMVGSDGGVFSFGDAAFYGSMAGKTLNGPIVGITSTSDGKGYWLVGSDGGVFAFGDAAFYGSMGGKTLNKPVTGMARTPDGKGYWLVGSDGGVFAFGDAKFEKSLPAEGVTPNAPIKGIASTADGGGYWLVGSDGGVFSFGDAAFYGSMGGETLNKPVVGIASTHDGKGYWLVAQDGGIFAFGDAGFYGSMAGVTLDGSVVGMAPDYKTGGYWEASQDAGIFSFNAPFEGSMGGSTYPKPPPPPPATLSTNYDWARLVLADGQWPQSANNIAVITQWMTSEEPTSDWFHNDNPLNNSLGTSCTDGNCPQPNLTVAASEVVRNLDTGNFGYAAITADLAASAAPGTTAAAIWDSSWAGSHYGYGASWSTGVPPTVAAPAADWG